MTLYSTDMSKIKTSRYLLLTVLFCWLASSLLAQPSNSKNYVITNVVK
ncbi:MAG: hypothetical protein JST39_24455, partial [Bacteroidetes bacterium]|nr:hypothetical protein [Bacteroidota bacterium]